ncbi:MAG TPA: 50S ribosomal protein L11 methyltransferase [Wenzhouxiangella sp.]
MSQEKSAVPPKWQTLRLSIRVEQTEQTAQAVDQTLVIEPIENALFEHGAVSVTLVDAEDHPLHEPDPGALPLWPTVIIEALFPITQDLSTIIYALIESGLIDADTPVESNTIEEQVWTRAWMDQFKPMPFGQRLWICPTHVDPEPDWPVVIRLDPGLAFGSGTHPTTALCLSWLDQWALNQARFPLMGPVIDFGCGSGILGIAAALLGSDKVLAIDHDPQALTATRDNAQINGCNQKISVFEPEAFFVEHSTTQSPLVLANILAKPLIELSPKLMALVAPGGYLVLSGILEDQAEAVRAAYQELDPNPIMHVQEDWVCLAFAQKA